MVTRYAHYDTSGDVYLPVMLNSVVHIIMYGYYFCGASGFTFQNVRVFMPFLIYILCFLCILGFIHFLISSVRCTWLLRAFRQQALVL